MKREHIVNPDDFAQIAGKLRAIEDSLDGLLDGTEEFRRDSDPIKLMASMTASIVVLHQVVAEMLKEEMKQ